MLYILDSCFYGFRIIASDNYVIYKRDTEEFSGFLKSLGDFYICFTCLQIPTGVVMRNDYAGGTIGDGVGENFAWVDEAASECTDRYSTLGNQTIGTIECQTGEVFLFFVADTAQLRHGLFQAVYNWPLAHFELPAPQLKPGHDLRRFGGAKALDGQ